MKGQDNRTSKSTGDQAMAELDHELGNVVNGLLGMARLVRESGLSAEQDYWVEAIEQSGQQLARLVEAFRLQGAAPDYRLPFHPIHLDGVRLLEQALISRSLAARAAGNRLLLIADPALARHWRSDPRLLMQLLDNLLVNAVEATRSGTILLEAAVERSGRRSPGTLILRVTDSGPGIDRALGQRMFDAYQRGSGTPGQARRGLGLFICRRIVQEMGGRIGWSNLEEGGACFEVSLPEVVMAVPQNPVPPPQLLSSLKCRLRLAGAVRDSVAALLERLGVRWVLDSAGRARRGSLTVLIEEQAPGPGDPGPVIVLSADHPRRAAASGIRLRAPILEGTLGPALLQLALEGVSAPDEGRG